MAQQKRQAQKWEHMRAVTWKEVKRLEKSGWEIVAKTQIYYLKREVS